ncbi:MAG: 50S ribosomal protein L23 [Parachlamydiaceae bacterium]|nr:50S ribosomal protein L23 [Parachlamydiaceae bacterium]
MTRKDPYQVIKHQHITEKSTMLLGLKDADSNPSLRRCKAPKYVFIVDTTATKKEIADALEEIYKERQIKVTDVNTINVKGKVKRYRGRLGKLSDFKKAIVTLEENDSLEDV